jgi:hypothetical protein
VGAHKARRTLTGGRRQRVVVLAARPIELGQTEALVAVHLVHADAVVETRLRLTRVDLDLTVVTFY